MYTFFETKKLETFFCFEKFCFEILKHLFLKHFFVSNKNVSITAPNSPITIFFKKNIFRQINENKFLRKLLSIKILIVNVILQIKLQRKTS